MLYLQLYGDVYYALYGNIFALQLYVSLLFFVIFYPRRNSFVFRAYLSTVGYFLLVNVIWFFIVKFAANNEFINIIFFFLCVVFLAAGIFVSFRINILGAIYYATGAYAVQHAAYSLGNIIKYILRIAMPVWAELIIFDILIFVLVGTVFFFIFVYPRRHSMGEAIFDIRIFVISAVTVAVCVILSIFADNIFADYLKQEINVFALKVCCSIYALISCTASVVIQFRFIRENKLTGERFILDQLIHSEKKRHEMSKETISIINAKCHDLKHQIMLLEKMDDKEERKKYIAELKDAIAIFDTSADTGNDALDIIISEKNLLCEENKISFSYLVDGAKLSFMSSTDIAALFGNALDNAIEKQMQEDEANRFISLSVREENGFVHIHSDNCCTVPPDFVDGLPQTTKKDKRYHGYGTKSILNIAMKYDGETQMYVDDGRFNLDILMPLNGNIA